MRSFLDLLQRTRSKLATTAIPMFLIAGILSLLFFGKPPAQNQPTQRGDWTCSMHPQVRLPKSGRCPLCGMALIPVVDLKSEQARVTLRAGIETERVQHRDLFKEIRTVGKIDYNESRVALLTARVAGRADRVYADFTGMKVEKHDHLVDIYSPQLVSAQAELMQALKVSQSGGSFALTNLEATRTKLRLLGILPEQIAEIEKSRTEATHLTIFAPIGGVVIEKNVREQQYVNVGDMLYRIAELDPIWLYLDIYEYDLGWLRFGQQVDLTVEAYPGEVFQGTTVFIDPFLNDQTRTVKVRVNLRNPEHRLKPAMYASATIHVHLQTDGTPVPSGLEGKFICHMHPEIVKDEAGKCPRCEMKLERVPQIFPARKIVATKPADGARPADSGKRDNNPPVTAKSPADKSSLVLAIRKSAVLDTGRRRATYRKRKDGAYELVDLRLGPLAEAKDDAGRVASFYPVLEGLNAGDDVVVQGGFMLDSQRQIEGMPSLLYADGHADSETKADTKQPPPASHQH